MTFEADFQPKKGISYIKRVVDLLLVIPLSIILVPLILIIVLVICLDSKGGPFYNQERVGLHGRNFMLFKFRTMNRNKSGIVIGKEVYKGDDRVTRLGNYLRRYKLDELPQIFNVILGHMTIVGPRPDIPVQVANYTDYQRQRLSVRPGLTGISQVSGNIWMPWSERIKMDVWYIHNWSLLLDLRIIWHTFTVLLHGEQPEADPFGLRIEILGKASDEKKGDY
jgi:undecaprenyl phosphate N,N'-diacetylbacillosamine 1-phosphate transferase